MIYVDQNFRFYDDSKDLARFPELKPTPDAVPLNDDEVKEITADISKWRWHPTEDRPYRIPDCAERYWKLVDGVVLEMTDVEKAAVDQAEADRIAAEIAAREAAEAALAAEHAALVAELDKEDAEISNAFPDWAQIEKAIDNATLAQMKVIIKKGFKVVYNLALWRRKVMAELRSGKT